MNHQGFHRSKRAYRKIWVGVLLFVFMLAWKGAGADEKYGMPSEGEARRLGSTRTNASAEQVVWVESLLQQEDRLFVNGEPFVLEHRTRFENERGAKIRWTDIPVGAQVEVQYRMGSRLEDSSYGPKDRILARMRLLQPPPRKKPVP